jgi:hypothetical protein
LADDVFVLYGGFTVGFLWEKHVCSSSYRLVPSLKNNTLEDTEEAIKMENSKKLATRRRKTQHNMCWTPLYTNKYKKPTNSCFT